MTKVPSIVAEENPGPMDVAIFNLMKETGIEISKLCALLLGDLEINTIDRRDNGVQDSCFLVSMKIRVKKTDGSKRIIRLSEYTSLAIEKYLQERRGRNLESPYLFALRQGRPIHRSTVRSALRKGLKGKNCKGMYAKTLRHEFITSLFNQNLGARTIRYLIDRKSLDIIKPSKN